MCVQPLLAFFPVVLAFSLGSLFFFSLCFLVQYNTKLCVLKLFFLLQALTKANNIVFGFIPRPSQGCFGQGLELTTTSSDEGKRERERESADIYSLYLLVHIFALEKDVDYGVANI